MKRLRLPILLILALFSLWLLIQPIRSRAAVDLPYIWTTETVDSTGDIGQFTSLAINPITNLPDITYFDLTELNVRHANPTMNPYDISCIGDWHCESYETDHADGFENSNSFMVAGQHRVIYYDAEAYKFMFLEDNGNGTFQTSQIANAISDGRLAPLQYDSDGIAHTAFFQNGTGPSEFQLVYATYVGTGGDCNPNGLWECDIVEDDLSFSTPGTKYVSLDFARSFSGSDTPRMAYGAGGSGLKYAHPVAHDGNCGGGESSEKWQCDQIDQIEAGSIALHVPKCILVCTYPVQLAYYDKTSHTLRYAYKVDYTGNCGIGDTEGQWQCDELDTFSFGLNARVSMAVHDGTPFIAYYNPDTNEGIFKVAYPFPVGNCGPTSGGGFLGTWKCDTVDSGYYAPNNTYQDVGQFASIGIDSDGIVYVSYYNASTGNLKVAKGIQLEPDQTPTPGPTSTPGNLNIFLPVIIR